MAMKKVIGIVMVLMMVPGPIIPVLSSAASAKDVKNVDYMRVNCEDGITLNMRESASKSAKVPCRVE